MMKVDSENKSDLRSAFKTITLATNTFLVLVSIQSCAYGGEDNTCRILRSVTLRE